MILLNPAVSTLLQFAGVKSMFEQGAMLVISSDLPEAYELCKERTET